MRVACLAFCAFIVMPSPVRSQQGLKLELIIPAQEIWEQFYVNEAKADMIYGGKPVAIEGTVRNVRKYPNGLYAAQLLIKSGNLLSNYNVTCFSKDAKLLSTLEPGEDVQVRGKCRGWEARGDDGLGDVIVENCVVVKKR